MDKVKKIFVAGNNAMVIDDLLTAQELTAFMRRLAELIGLKAGE
ncbi:hypothetical protein [Pseudothermotoga sp.]